MQGTGSLRSWQYTACMVLFFQFISEGCSTPEVRNQCPSSTGRAPKYQCNITPQYTNSLRGVFGNLPNTARNSRKSSTVSATFSRLMRFERLFNPRSWFSRCVSINTRGSPIGSVTFRNFMYHESPRGRGSRLSCSSPDMYSCASITVNVSNVFLAIAQPKRESSQAGFVYTCCRYFPYTREVLGEPIDFQVVHIIPISTEMQEFVCQPVE